MNEVSRMPTSQAVPLAQLPGSSWTGKERPSKQLPFSLRRTPVDHPEPIGCLAYSEITTWNFIFKMRAITLTHLLP